MQALHRYLVFFLIDGASLTYDPCNQKYKLILNDSELSIGYSEPYSVCFGINQNLLETGIVFCNVDDWTPPTNVLPHGIDPIAAKWILHSLAPEEKQHLVTLLLEDIIDDEHIRFKQFRTFLSQFHEKGEQIYLCYDLICEMAISIEKKFPEVIAKEWNNFAKEDIPLPIEKEKQPTSLSPYVPWNKPLTKNAILSNAFDEIELFWKQFSNNDLESPPSKSFYPPWGEAIYSKLSKYFYIVHPMIDLNKFSSQGCLFSALTASLFQKVECLQLSYSLMIKKQMGQFLSQNKDRFQDRVKKEMPRYLLQNKKEEQIKPFEVYLDWLNGNNNDVNYLELGQLEIEIFAEAFGIQVVVIEPGRKLVLDSEGVLIPHQTYSQSYGPNTKEKIFLLNREGRTFSAMFPRIKSDGPLNDFFTRWSTLQAKADQV